MRGRKIEMDSLVFAFLGGFFSVNIMLCTVAGIVGLKKTARFSLGISTLGISELFGGPKKFFDDTEAPFFMVPIVQFIAAVILFVKLGIELVASNFTPAILAILAGIVMYTLCWGIAGSIRGTWKAATKIISAWRARKERKKEERAKEEARLEREREETEARRRQSREGILEVINRGFAEAGDMLAIDHQSALLDAQATFVRLVGEIFDRLEQVGGLLDGPDIEKGIQEKIRQADDTFKDVPLNEDCQELIDGVKAKVEELKIERKVLRGHLEFLQLKSNLLKQQLFCTEGSSPTEAINDRVREVIEKLGSIATGTINDEFAELGKLARAAKEADEAGSEQPADKRRAAGQKA